MNKPVVAYRCSRCTLPHVATLPVKVGDQATRLCPRCATEAGVTAEHRKKAVADGVQVYVCARQGELVTADVATEVHVYPPTGGDGYEVMYLCPVCAKEAKYEPEPDAQVRPEEQPRATKKPRKKAAPAPAPES